MLRRDVFRSGTSGGVVRSVTGKAVSCRQYLCSSVR